MQEFIRSLDVGQLFGLAALIGLLVLACLYAVAHFISRWQS